MLLTLLIGIISMRTVAQDLAQIQDNGTAVLLIDSEKLVGHLNRFVSQVASIEADFTAVEIIRIEDGHVLVATGETYQTALALENSASGPGVLRATGLSCTTGCGAEPGVCMPEKSTMTCVPTCQTGTCSRTVSVDTDVLTY